MDWILDKLEEQLDRISKQLRKDDDAVDKPKYEASNDKSFENNLRHIATKSQHRDNTNAGYLS